MKERMLINDKRINGIELLLRRFPSFTRRQVWALYDQATRDKLTYEEISKATIHIENPQADVGKSFGITITLPKKK